MRKDMESGVPVEIVRNAVVMSIAIDGSVEQDRGHVQDAEQLVANPVLHPDAEGMQEVLGKVRRVMQHTEV